MHKYTRLFATAFLGALLSACGREPAAEASRVLDAGTPVAASARASSMCTMLPAAEMSTLLGSAVTAESAGRSDRCTYSPASGYSPSAEVSIAVGDGEAAMQGASFANGREPGLVDPLAGLGDQAIGVGPMVMIRRGHDLVSIRLSGVDDTLAKVREVYSALSTRM
jgi:hypothetical protein